MEYLSNIATPTGWRIANIEVIFSIMAFWIGNGNNEMLPSFYPKSNAMITVDLRLYVVQGNVPRSVKHGSFCRWCQIFMYWHVKRWLWCTLFYFVYNFVRMWCTRHVGFGPVSMRYGQESVEIFLSHIERKPYTNFSQYIGKKCYL